MIYKPFKVAILSLLLCSCATNMSQTQPKTDDEDVVAHRSPHSHYKHALHKVRKSLPKMTAAQQEEYVKRVGKKVAIVSDDPDTDLDIRITSQEGTFIESNGNKVVISRGYLKQLKSEAQLAAVLGQIIAKMQNKQSVDKSSMEYMARAGYDPKALSEMQEHAVTTSNNGLQSQVHNGVDESTVSNNREYAKRFPKGLKTNEFDYQKNFYN